MSKFAAAAIVVALGTLALSPAASAGIISVNFSNANDTDTGTRGFVPAGYWTLFGNQGNGPVSLPNLKNNSGTATTADLTWTSANIRAGQTTTGTLNEQMIVSGMTLKPNKTITLGLAQIPYAQYDLYVYVTDTDGTQTMPMSVTVGATAFHLTTPADNLDFFQDSGFVQSTSTVPTSANANYVLFSGLSAASQSIVLAGDEIGPAGIQIVEVPEPATLALLGLGGLGMLIRRKR